MQFTLQINQLAYKSLDNHCQKVKYGQTTFRLKKMEKQLQKLITLSIFGLSTSVNSVAAKAIFVSAANSSKP
jgi:hypothetical protein